MFSLMLVDAAYATLLSAMITLPLRAADAAHAPLLIIVSAMLPPLLPLRYVIPLRYEFRYATRCVATR